MSHFYSSCQGGRGEATRCGHKSTGIRASVQSHTGSIITRLWVDDEGNDCYEINIAGHSTNWGGYTVMSGRLQDLVDSPLPLYHDFEQAMKSLVFGGAK